MISGRQALREIQEALQREKARLRELDSRLTRSNDELLKLDARRMDELQRLARLRLQFLSMGELPEQDDDTARSVLTLVEQRNEAYREVQAKLSAIEEETRRQQEKGGELADERQRLAEEISAAEERTQERLADDPDYQRQLALAHEAERIAAQADAKATQREQELELKGTAYREDRLFTYLWERGYGTPDYRPGGGPLAPLFRWLDGKVARLIGYADARPNYQRLLEMPERLREHAERAAERAEAEFEELKRLDLQGRVDDGIPELEAQLEEVEAKLEAHERETQAQSEEAQAALSELDAFAQGADTYYQNAVALLRAELQNVPLQVLRSEALATPSPDDDVIVARLREQTREREQIAATAAEMKESASQHRKRVSELERLRADYLRTGMDAPNSGFRDGQVLSSGLQQFLTGLLTVEALWRLFNQQRVRNRTGSDPDFGSGGFGRGTVWGGGRSYPRHDRGGGMGADIAGDIIGGILGGLLSGSAGGRRSSGGGFGGGFGGGSRSGGLGRGSRGGKSGGFRTGGRVRGGKFRTGGKF